MGGLEVAYPPQTLSNTDPIGLAVRLRYIGGPEGLLIELAEELG